MRHLLTLLYMSTFAFALSCPPQPKIVTDGCGQKPFAIDSIKTNGFPTYSVRYDINDIKKKNWAGFKCPKLKNSTAVLTSLDIDSGNFVCSYQDGEHNQLTAICSYKNLQCSKNVQKIKTTEAKNFTVSDFEVFGMLEKPFEVPQSWITEKLAIIIPTSWVSGSVKFSFNKSGLFGQLNKVEKDLKKLKNGKKKNILDIKKSAEKYNLFEVFSDTPNQKVKLSDFALGLITLDPDIVSGVNKDGSIQFSQAISNTFLAAKTKTNEIVNFAQNKTDIKNKLYSMGDIFDAKIWGFFATFIKNLNVVFASIVMYAFMIGGVYMIIHIGYQKIATKFTREEEHFRFDTYNRLILIAIAFTFFSAPVNKTNLEFDNIEMIAFAEGNKTNNSQNQKTAKVQYQGYEDYTEYSTFYQTFIQYFATLSNKFADRVSAISTYSFAGYIEAKNELLLDHNDYNEQIKQIYLDMHSADLNARFYRNICSTNFGYWNSKETFLENGKGQLDFDVLPKNKNDFIKNFGAETLTLQVCQQAERTAINKTISSMHDYFALEQRLEIIDKNGLENHAKATNAVINNLFSSEAQLGWINIVSVPFQYYLFDNADLFADSESINNKIDDISEKITNQNLAYEEGDFGDRITNSIEKGSATVIGNLIGFQALNFLPGFSSIKEGISNFIKGIDSSSGAKVSKNKIVRSVKNLATKLAKGPITFLLDQVVSTSATMGKQVFIYTITYIIAAALFLKILQLMLGLSVALMGLIRVLFYYLSVMKYFIISPLIVLWATTTQNGNKVVDFIGQGAMLFMQPIMIVISISIFIFANEFLRTLYEYLLGMVLHNSKVNFTTMTTIANDNFLDSLSNYALFTSIDIFFQIVLSLISLVLAYKIVFSDSWFTGLFGWDKNNAGSGNARSVGESAGRFVNPIGGR